MTTPCGMLVFSGTGDLTLRKLQTSMQIYSLIETVQTNGQKPYVWLRHILKYQPKAQSVEN